MQKNQIKKIWSDATPLKTKTKNPIKINLERHKPYEKNKAQHNLYQNKLQEKCKLEKYEPYEPYKILMKSLQKLNTNPMEKYNIFSFFQVMQAYESFLSESLLSVFGNSTYNQDVDMLLKSTTDVYEFELSLNQVCMSLISNI